MTHPGKWQGMLTVARFNWPMYLAAAMVFFLTAIAVFFAQEVWLRGILAVVAFACLYLIVVSLSVSHWVYDRSDLYRWKWLGKALPGQGRPEQVIFCHSGFDECSASLAEEIPSKEWLNLDHYDPEKMSEPSIKLARKLFPPEEGTIAADFDKWPLEQGRADLVFGILAIHELREVEARSAWFREAGRALKASGRIVIVEHVRDTANFLAFGPGFLHFHSHKKWRESWSAAGLCLERELKITPFLRVFVLKNDD